MAASTPWQTRLEAVLSATRRAIRRRAITLGTAQATTLAALGFWLLEGWDQLYFLLTRLEQPQLVRTALIYAAAIGLAAFGVWWAVTRVFRRLDHETLAETIEASRPQLADRLITAVQSRQRREGDDPIADRMASRTQRDAVDRLEDFDPASLLRAEPLKRWTTAAVVLLGAVAAVAAFNPSQLARWGQAYLFGADDYWNTFRTTRVELAVARGQPEVLVPFESGRVKAARGATLTVVAAIAEGTRNPGRVRLTLLDRSPYGDEQTVSMIEGSSSEYRHTLARVFDDIDLWVRAGDFATATPLRIEVVDPPDVAKLELVVRYPDYTGLAATADTDGFVRLPVQSSSVGLPEGTTAALVGTANKPLSAAKFVVGTRRIDAVLGDDAATIAAVPAGTDEMFAVPFEVAYRSQSEKPGDDGLLVAEPLDVEIRLRDRDDLRSLVPLQLGLRPVADAPPEVSARPRGIGEAVTRRATIPWAGELLDDYGIQQVWFELGRESSERPQRRDIELDRIGRSLVLEPSAESPVRLDLRESGLELGESITVALAAADRYPPGSQVGRSERLRLTVVSDEELLAILRGKELNLRQRFEQIVEEVTATRDDVRALRTREQAARATTDDAERMNLRQQISGGIDRGLLAVRKNQSEAAAVLAVFADLRDELVNNRVGTRERLSRIDNGVLVPLRRVVDRQFGEVDAAVEAARDAVRSRGEIAASLATADGELSRLVERLAAILAEMERRQSYNELIEELERLTERYEQLEKRTKDKSVDSFLDDLLP